ncbi:thioredoxin [Microcoleus sp. FACHB-1515]|uniref:thioredoxin n=1 Tax=Cyanophyceae TaxID=3028117 RepID=UPI001687924A|nr:thioredoxin [Microcoleus sp. FACHB-1515]MBD2092268.1 thioredoxin [Microcoleus sp. FACHB-1515]
MTTSPVVLTDENFDRLVLQSAQPVLIDFWAAWCGPCRMLSPIVEQIASDFAGRAFVAKLNVDDYPRLATRYGVQAVPTLLFFQNGRAIDQIVGVVTADTIATHLNALLPAAA